MLTDSLHEQLTALTYERCRECQSLIATDLRRDRDVLDAIYRQLPQSYWQGLNLHAGFERVIEQHLHDRAKQRGDLWDVGCGSGHLLSTFGSQWTKAGIEPGLAAVNEARDQGLNVIAGTASTLGLKNVADVVMLIDVVEHLTQPETELRAVYDMLRPGGVVVLFTGIADAWTARFAGPRWYYLHCIGHVTVFGSAALQSLLSRLGFIDVTVDRVEHPGAVGLRRWLQRIGGNVLRRVLGRRAGAMHIYRDHQLVLAVKPDSLSTGRIETVRSGAAISNS